MTPQQIFEAGKQYVTYTVFVSVLALQVTLVIFAFGGVRWVREADISGMVGKVEAVEKLANDRWGTHMKNEAEHNQLLRDDMRRVEVKVDALLEFRKSQ